jgi:hypothetical protein
MRYFVNGVEKTLSVGVYPEISLSGAAGSKHSNSSHASGGGSTGICGRRNTPTSSSRAFLKTC